MIDITHKVSTLRRPPHKRSCAPAPPRPSRPSATAVPKGDVFEMGKAAGLLGVKKTADLLPDCHPMPVECAKVDYAIEGLDVIVTMYVKTITRPAWKWKRCTALRWWPSPCTTC